MMPFGATAPGVVSVALPAWEMPNANVPNTMFPTAPPPTSSSFVSSGTTLPGQDPTQGFTQNLQETMAQYAAMFPTITTAAAPASTDFMLTLPGGTSFDVTTFLASYWWALALGAVVLFWPKGKGRR